MFRIAQEQLSLINPTVTLVNNNPVKSNNLIGIIFYEDMKYHMFELPNSKVLNLSLYSEIKLLEKLNYIIISIIDYNANEVFKTELLIDKKNIHKTYSNLFSKGVKK